MPDAEFPPSDLGVIGAADTESWGRALGDLDVSANDREHGHPHLDAEIASRDAELCEWPQVGDDLLGLDARHVHLEQDSRCARLQERHRWFRVRRIIAEVDPSRFGDHR